ncbi:hypothetical protein PIB30_033794 [Stylosanthes scabra]|uniref:Uncharacterized protein n=1 Tax=Stylosanthes scabra TaxID=79078 RepID=A0ABU6WB24_9FABA|nr:hypothetical protein [Stylosanthes scabra]
MEAQLSTIADLVTCLTTQLSHNNSSTSQTPIDISHEEDEAFEKVDEQEMKVEVQTCEEVCDNKQELEVEEARKELGFEKQESKGAKTTLTHPLRTSLANLPSNTSFEWSEDELMVGWQHESRLKNEIISRLDVQGRCKAKINGFQTRNWGSRKHLESWPLQGKHDNQQENGWTLKIWDPGIQFNNQQLWRFLLTIVTSHFPLSARPDHHHQSSLEFSLLSVQPLLPLHLNQSRHLRHATSAFNRHCTHHAAVDSRLPPSRSLSLVTPSSNLTLQPLPLS